MRPVTDLGKLYGAFAYRILRIRRLFDLAGSSPEPRRSEFISVSVIELDNLILSSLRALTISSLRCGRTSQRNKISTTRRFGDEQEIAAFMLSILHVKSFQKLRSPTRVSRRDEPKVRDPRATEIVFASCGASNIGSLRNALALNTTLFADLPILRNFYAHRNEDTWRKVRTKAHALGVFRIKHPNELLMTMLPGRPVTLFEDWLDDAELFFEEATK